jgi:hypothetical protein
MIPSDIEASEQLGTSHGREEETEINKRFRDTMEKLKEVILKYEKVEILQTSDEK